MKLVRANHQPIVRLATLGLLVATMSFAAAPTQAQPPLQQIGVDPFGFPICAGPLGPGRCADIIAWMQRGGNSSPAGGAIPAPPGGNFGMGPLGPAGLPTNIVPHDGQLVAEIAQSCGGNPQCMAVAWGSVEVQRCVNGVGVSGGCFGPNGEIAKAARVILRDLVEGPGPHNDLVGKEGFVCKNIVSIFGSC